MYKEDRSSLAVLRAVKEQVDEKFSTKIIATWSQEQWWESFSFLFIPQSLLETEVEAAHLQHNDDLLFFVHAKPTTSNGQRKASKTLPGLDAHTPFSVRRRGKRLSSEWQKSGIFFHAIAWDETLLLNLVLQTRFNLTAIVCRTDLLPQVAGGLTSSEGVHLVTRRVYASPVQTLVNLDQPDEKSSNSSTRPCYPDVCFAVDNFDDAFGNMVMDDPEDCFCVIMHAMLPTSSAPHTSMSNQDPDTESKPVATSKHAEDSHPVAKHNRLVIFSGYVTHDQVASRINSQVQQQRGSFFTMLRKSQQAGANREKILMAGPGGMGQAEVAVQLLPQEEGSDDRSRTQPSSQPAGMLRSILDNVASLLLDDDEQAPAPPLPESSSMKKLQCALMSLRLPVDKLARNILES